MESPRLPRFNRSPDITAMRLTSRDIEILGHVHRHRFLRSDHVATLVTGSRPQILRRLQLLYHHGFLDRPRCQIDYYHRTGSRPMAYGLGKKGSGLLKRKFGLPFHHSYRFLKNQVERFFLEHTLMVADVMVGVEVACRKRSDLRLLGEDELESPPRRRPFQWKVEIGRGRRLGVIPDGVFGLEFANMPRGRNRIWFFVEVDRGTMPIARQGLAQTSVRRKFLAYRATWEQGLHRKLGFDRFRVLTLTPHQDRIASMREVCRAPGRGRGLFLFAPQGAIAPQYDPFSRLWRTCESDAAVGLLDDRPRGSPDPPE